MFFVLFSLSLIPVVDKLIIKLYLQGDFRSIVGVKPQGKFIRKKPYSDGIHLTWSAIASFPSPPLGFYFHPDSPSQRFSLSLSVLCLVPCQK